MAAMVVAILAVYVLAGGTREDSRLDPGAGGADLILPRIPWEGGPSYWGNFAKAEKAGWTNLSFFPIVAWYDSVSNASETDFDKSLGINTYVGMPATVDSALLDAAGMYWIGGPLNATFTPSTPNWVGYFLDDEVDGRFPPAEGRSHLQALAAKVPPGFFSYANFTSMVVEGDLPAKDSEQYVNDYANVVSVDKYWYTIPQCSQLPYRNVLISPIAADHCRTASSYGKTITALRQRDASDGKLAPLWAFVENMTGADRPDTFGAYITPEQLQGAVFSSIIHEARGIVYFNQSLSGPCKSGNVFRDAQVVPGFCGDAQVQAVKRVNTMIRSLAPVINTQSYEWNFGEGLDTMLKVYNGSTYVFAMLDGASNPGDRSFKLPPGVGGKTVEVLDEGRVLPVQSDGHFTDRFDHEFSYHIYKVKI
ncbi:hypothetical protein [Arthrobacter wenxiniae]|jgi:hypothetical protein|uniref:Uncharacterized protein n=1 Tax=Arthrobacter wenxiniae TaxID=2713570 RepID=A0A7Y7LZ57_9MICC|nr:hypothetical protein [Arthrobacter wenxiniae]NVM94403.1 hypothetical protein [Arthrobacter wenxiniae]